MKTVFIGHRQVFAKGISEKLANAIKVEIDRGCTSFIVGTHGEFDSLALNVCRRLRHVYKSLDIEVAITSLNAIKKNGKYDISPYADVSTVMFDIEEAHFKRQITLCNRRMIDNCDTLICYVDTSACRSGAKTALRYAKKRGLRIVNLYCKEDQPFYGMTKEQADEYIKSLIEKVLR